MPRFTIEAATPRERRAMGDSTHSVQRDHVAQRANKILSGMIACAVLGVGGVMAYQNSDALQVPDRNSAWANIWTKKLSSKSGIPKFEAPDWEKNAFDPSTLSSQGIQFNPAQFSTGRDSSSSVHRRR